MNDKQDKTEYLPATEPSTYQTGSTKPPKNHRGLIFVLLGIVIFLGGIVTGLGVTNVRLFQALEAQKEPVPNAFSFAAEAFQATPDNARQTGLGFSGETVSEFWHTYHQLPRGIFIQAVEEGSDAARQGVLPGDILIGINGDPVTAFEDLPENPEGPIEIQLFRNNEQLTLRIWPGE